MRYNKTIMKNWNFYFQKVDGYENRDTIIRDLIAFLDDASRTELNISGYCRFSGEVHGHDAYREGSRIISSYVRRVRKIETEETNKKISHDLLSVETCTGNRYLFFSDEPNTPMSQMIRDMKEHGCLDKEQGAYIENKKYAKGANLL